MLINPHFNDVPHIKEKIKNLEKQIELGKRTIANWERNEPSYPLLPEAKNQLKMDIKMLNCITKAEPCP